MRRPARKRRRSDSRASPATPHRGLAELTEKYQSVCAKYAEAVRRLQERTAERSAMMSIAVTAMHSDVAAYALVRHGRVVAQNARFRKLDSKRSTWRSSEGEEFANLRSLALSRIGALGASTTYPPEEFEDVQGGDVIEVRLEQSARMPLALVMVMDVTARARAAGEGEAPEMMIEERMRAIGELASGFAHEFNNSLHAMRLWIARVSQSATAEQRRGLDALERAVSEAAARVGQLQDLARKREDEPATAVDAAAVLAEAVEMCRPELVGRSVLSLSQILIRVDVPDDLPLVAGVPAELRQVFVNILLNARDAMSAGGTIEVIGREKRGRVVIEIKDEGTGIPDENLPRVFDPFFSTKHGRGTGFGLSIAHGVMRRLGGRIAIANRPERGAVVTLWFPIATSPATAAKPEPELGRPRSGQRVLVIDDDPDVLEAMSVVLEGLEQVAVSVPSGPEALERLERGERFDVVLCDIGMPGMNGWQVAERVQAVAPGTTVYMVTGWAHEISRDDPKRTLVAGVLPKPLGLDELERVLRSPTTTGATAEA